MTFPGDQREAFEANGFAGPFTAFSPEEAVRLREHVASWIGEPSRIFGFPTRRDRHLESKTLCDACLHPAIVERCVQFLGEDLLLWRVSYRTQAPRHTGFQWHQDWDFPGVGQLPALEPVRGLTCWLALTEMTQESGCVGFVPGMRRELIDASRVIPGTEDRGPHVVTLSEDEPAPVYPELRPGEFVVFDTGTLHGSAKNLREVERVGLAIRVTTTGTRVYPGQRVDGQGYSLDRWHAVLMHGEDAFGLNRVGARPGGEFRRMGWLGRLGRRVWG